VVSGAAVRVTQDIVTHRCGNSKQELQILAVWRAWRRRGEDLPETPWPSRGALQGGGRADTLIGHQPAAKEPPMSQDLIRLDVTDAVAMVELNRPEAANALDLPLAERLTEVVEQLAAPQVRAVLLTGAGKRFCAGGDVRSFLASDDPPAYVEQLASVADRALERLAGLDKPVVAAVHGAVAGAGLAVMLSCDLVVAASGTRFVTAYAGIGLTPDCGVSWLLPRAVGQQRALELLLTPRVLTAEEARDWGLVTEVVDDSAVIDRGRELAVSLAAGPASAFGQARRLVRSSYAASRAETGADEARTIAAAVRTDDAQRLITAFTSR
jgi:2-(1,2-epoxy-1,2-dihydrophenyl)acetyl-CoA isomerase